MNADRRCDLCRSGTWTTLFVVEGIPVVKCDVCSLVFSLSPVEENQLIDLYDQDYYEEAAEVGYGGYAATEARKRVHDRSLLDEIERLTPAGRLLEIGCAYGFFLDEARQRSWQVRGVEPSPHAAQQAVERFGLDVTTTPFTELPPEPATLTAITMWDVLEHLPNPRATVAAAREWLRPGGVIAISTGDVGSSAARLHGADWSLMTPPWHQFYFSRATLRRLLRDSGFEIERVTGDGSIVVDPAAKRRRVPRPVETVLTKPIVTRVARRLGAGSIMFAFARKAGS